jgi:hypothetical protein
MRLAGQAQSPPEKARLAALAEDWLELAEKAHEDTHRTFCIRWFRRRWASCPTDLQTPVEVLAIQWWRMGPQELPTLKSPFCLGRAQCRFCAALRPASQRLARPAQSSIPASPRAVWATVDHGASAGAGGPRVPRRPCGRKCGRAKIVKGRLVVKCTTSQTPSAGNGIFCTTCRAD